jgi:Helix-turn-helix domain
MAPRYSRWTSAEDALLIEAYQDPERNTQRALAQKLGRSVNSVASRVWLLELVARHGTLKTKGKLQANAASKPVVVPKRKNLLIAQLVARRAALGWSLRQLAGRSGYDSSQILRWEREEIRPSFNAFHNWAEALGLQVGLSVVSN